MKSLRDRSTEPEMMDDPDCDPVMLDFTLREIAKLNRLAGAHSIFRRRFVNILDSLPADRISILDVGSGIGDIPVHLVKWTKDKNLELDIVSTDVREDIVRIAIAYADQQLGSGERGSLSHETADVFSLPFADNQFDISIANQVLHHFSDENVPMALSELNRVARYGVFVEDLHRHRLPYAFVIAVTRLLRFTKMVQTDGPISVRSGFTRSDIEGYFRRAGLEKPSIFWHPTFRWVISSISADVNV